MPASLTDVAKAAGVSIATASRILTGIDYPVSEPTRQKVLKAANELGYRPNLIARSLRKEQTLTVGIIVENILSPFIPPIIRGIQSSLKEHDYLSIILDSNWDPVIETEAVERLGMRQIDGIIFVESYLRSPDEVSPLIDKPYLFVHRLFNSLGANSIVPDDRYSARLVVRHLAELGHRRIAFINGPEEWDAASNRLAGYQEELAARGIPFDPLLVKPGDWQVQSGYLAAQQLLGIEQRPAAVFAANDLMALGVIYAAQEAGLHVPGDIAIVGYDDRDFAGFVRPALTTVRMPCEKMGQIAAESLLRLIRGEVKVIEPTLVRGELVVRQSCGARSGEWQFEPERASLTRRHRQRTRRPGEVEKEDTE
ncbi:MAG TPA: LacI family DNA-binding transcriptional regulator [Caldilineaceae bacterium]|nr:LacI family DNA-binding transcriptional regulator [Caldilineaceae bacterium]